MVEFELNGEKVSVDVPGDTPLLWVIREELKSDRHQVWLRQRALRCLYHAHGWGGHQNLRIASDGCGRQKNHHH